MKRKSIYMGSIVIIAIIFFGTLQLLFSDSDNTSTRGFLGIGIEELSSALKNQLGIKEGVVVTWIEEDSPAEKAGIQEDDIIVRVNDTIIKKTSTLTRTIKKIEPGTKVKIELYRNGKQQTAEAEIGKYKSRKSFSEYHVDEHCFISAFQRPYLGVSIVGLNEDLASYFGVKKNEGVLISEVKEDSPAEDGGLKAGDVIIAIENEKVTSSDDAMEVLSDYEADDEISIDIIRHEKKQSVQIVLKERDGNKSNFLFHNLPGKNFMKMEFDDEIIKTDDDEHDQIIRLKKKDIPSKDLI